MVGFYLLHAGSHKTLKFTLVQARRERGTVLLFHLSARWGGWLTPRSGSFTSGKATRYPLYRRLGGPQSGSERVLKILPPTRIRSPDRPACSESLYRLSYPGPLLAAIPLHYNPMMMMMMIAYSVNHHNVTHQNFKMLDQVRHVRTTQLMRISSYTLYDVIL